MTMTVTLISIGVSLSLVILMLWLESRPRELGDVRLIPRTPVLFFFIIVTIVLCAHLVTLMGGKTGKKRLQIGMTPQVEMSIAAAGGTDHGRAA